ncbi:MAG: hypothetical protein DYG94_09820 [Leptolyngbya sp. PLA3]|nr:MAG: hypothetical protein EDM82_07875 [Cyanobacteria bacterium CYA]MCE7969027.1 hypothetical protein [Leptolyngbya sp. PL-A3]
MFGLNPHTLSRPPRAADPTPGQRRGLTVWAPVGDAAPIMRRGSALPRTPVLLVAAVLLGGAYLVVVARLGPALFPPTQRPPAGATDTAEMATLRAVEAILASVQTAVQAEELDKARTILDQAVAQFPRDQMLWLARADLLIRLAYPDAAKSIRQPDQRALIREAYDAQLKALEIGPRAPDLEFAAGSMARSLGDLDSALAHFGAAHQADRSNAAYPLNLAQVYLARDELDQAKAQATVAVSLDPDLANAWGMLAEIALRQSEPRMASQHIEKATSIEPTEPAWRHMQARACNRLAQAPQALAALDALKPEDRFSRVSLQLAGEAFGLLGQPEQALTRYEDALASGAADPEIMLDAALWAERLGQRDRALELATRARAEGLERADRVIERLTKPENPGG